MRSEQIRANFADNIKTLRKKLGVSQVEFGERLGFSDKTISKWENGDVMPDVATLDHIASYFKITVNDLIAGKTSFKIQKKKRNALIIVCTFFGILALASLCYLFFAKVANLDRAWLVFLCAPIVFFISMIVLSAVFFDYKHVLLGVSLLTWSLVIALFFAFLDMMIWELFLFGGSLQILYVVLLFIIGLYKKKESKINQVNGKE